MAFRARYGFITPSATPRVVPNVTPTVTASVTRTITGSQTDTITGTLDQTITGGVTINTPAGQVNDNTTGHVWDEDLQEWHNPLPSWWMWLFYITIVWSIGYWIVYPAWPGITGWTNGLFGWNSRPASSRPWW